MGRLLAIGSGAAAVCAGVVATAFAPLPVRRVVFGTPLDLFEDLLDACRTLHAPTWPLRGNFRPVREERAIRRLTVIDGAVPRDVTGAFVRNGPDAQFEPRGGYHWFDGDGMVHAVHFRGGAVSYANSWVRTPRWSWERGLGKAVLFKLGDMAGVAGLLKLLVLIPLRQLLGLIPSGKYTSGTANTNLLFWKDRVFALVESDFPFAIRVREDGVESIGHETFGGQLDFSVIAHPKADRRTGELLTFGYLVQEPHDAEYAVFNPAGEKTAGMKLKLRQKAMVHDIAITESHTILPEFSLVFEPQRVVTEGCAFGMDYTQNVRFHVFPRHATSQDEAIVFDTAAPGMGFHMMNAMQVDADTIRMWGSVFRNFTMAFGGEANATTPGVLYQWTLHLRSGTVDESVVYDAHNIDFVRVSDDLVGYDARWGYGALFHLNEPDEGPAVFGAVKIDLRTGAVAGEVRFGAGRVGGETIFVPRDDPAAEDDGYLVTIVFDEALGQSEVVMYDAATMAPEPVARVLIPQRVPFGFHAAWLSAAQLAAQR